MIAPYESFACQDGYINIAAGNDNLFAKLCASIGLKEMTKDPRFENNGLRVKNREALIATIEARTKTYKLKDLQKILDDAGIPNGPIWSLDQTLTSEQAYALDMIKEVNHASCGKIKVTGVPVKLSKTPGAVVMAPPTLGQHTQEVLTQVLGYSMADVERLRKEGAI